MWYVKSEQNDLESSTIDRESRVREAGSNLEDLPSNAVCVKLCMNLSGPPDKAKY